MTTFLLAALLACTPTPPTPPAAAADPAPTAEAAPAPTEPSAGPATADPAEPAAEPTAEPTPAPGTDPTDAPKPQSAAPLPAGSACLDGAACASGVCEGEGCGDDTPGVCAPDRRACTRDARPYCGCDGQTFVAGGNCPLRRYAHKGACEPAPGD